MHCLHSVVAGYVPNFSLFLFTWCYITCINLKSLRRGTITMSPHLWELDTLEDAEGHLQRLDFQPFKLQNLVNGILVPHPHNDWIDSMNPKTGLHFACIPNSTPEQVDQAVKAADAAFPAWSTTPPSQRSQYLQRIASRIEEQRELFAVWESIDQGKTLTRARVEIDRAVSNFRWDNSESLCILMFLELTCATAQILCDLYPAPRNPCPINRH